MSLINDALKKAQKQRSLEPAAGVATAPTQAPAPPKAAPLGKAPHQSKSRSLRPLVIIGLCAVGLSAVSVGTTLFILQSDSPSAPRPAKNVAQVTSVASVAPAPKPAGAVAPANVTPPASAPLAAPAIAAAPAFEAPTPVPSPPPVVTPPAKAEPPAFTPPPAPAEVNFARSRQAEPCVPLKETDAPVSPPIPERPKASMRIQGVIDKLRVAGIRVSPTESKVILNERLFRLNDVVDPATGLRLTVVELHALTFTDAAGFTYVKLF